jgi:hypothetical protein
VPRVVSGAASGAASGVVSGAAPSAAEANGAVSGATSSAAAPAVVHLVRSSLRARLSRCMRVLTTAPSPLSPQVGSLPELDSRAVKSSVKKDWRQWLGAYARVDDLMVNGRPAYR